MKLDKFHTMFGTMLLSVAFAVPVSAGTSVLQAESKGIFKMLPGAGSNAASESPAAKKAIRTRVAGSDRAWVARKNQSATLTVEDAENPAVEVPMRVDSAAPAPLFPSRTCSTNIATGFAPSDIHGAAGTTVLVVVTNVDIGVYNKSTCALISRVPLKTLFVGFGDIANQTLFDPRVIYDRAAGRFLVTAESRDNRANNSNQYQYFAVSQTSAAAAWFRYRFTLSEGNNFFCKRAVNSFWDYPSAGKSANRWFITANDFPAAGGATGALIAIDKAPTLTGAAVTARCFNNLAFNIAPPIVLDSLTSQSVFLAPNTATITRYNHASGATVNNDTLTPAAAYNIADWTTPPDAIQPNGQKLDSLDGRFQSASIQSRDRIWNIHTINFSGRPLIRWYRLQRTASTVLSTVTFQSTSTSHLFNPSFVTNSGLDGSPAYITASRTEPSAACVAASCRAAMITFSGPNNSSADWSQGLAATSSTNFATTNGVTACNNDVRGSCRWGDYSAITVDPLAAGHAWAFNQLISGPRQFDWFTRGAEETYNIQFGPAGSP